MSDTSKPSIWMNVTGTGYWRGPVIGMARVEQQMRRHLRELYGEQYRECFWLDGAFVEWVQRPAMPTNLAAMGLLPWLNLWIPKLFRRYRRNVRNWVKRALKIDHRFTHPFKPGDILLALSFEWDWDAYKKYAELKQAHGIKIVGCCSDLSPVLLPHMHTDKLTALFAPFLHEMARTADLFLCLSKHTRKDLLAFMDQQGMPPTRTQVMELGDDVPTGQGAVSDRVAALTRERFILFVSTVERRKNHEVLYRAYTRLVQAYGKEALPKLVFVGREGWHVQDLMRDIALDPQTQGLIQHLVQVNDAELLKLYESALFCVYPSLYEGWGLPVGEALSLGKAVIASDRASLPEVGAELVRYIDPWDVAGWADALHEWSTDDAVRHEWESRVREQYRPRAWRDIALRVKEAVDPLAIE